MPPRYSSLQLVADHLGVALTGPQAAETERALVAAEAWLDQITGRTWDGAAPAIHTAALEAQGLALPNAPVAAIVSLEVRPPQVGAAWTGLAGSSYELVDPAAGTVLLPWGYAGWWVRVTYTPTAGATDPRIVRAATLLAADWVQPTLAASTAGAIAPAPGGGAVSYQVGDVRVSYGAPPAGGAAAARGGVAGLALPPDVLTLLTGLTAVVLA